MNETIGMTPFEANFGYHPTLDPEIESHDDSFVPAAGEHVKQLRTIHRILKLEIEAAQYQQKRFADARRRDVEQLEPGMLVWLERRNISTDRPNSKLDHRRLGPFKILERINPVAYRLELPHSMRVHPVFHVSLLQPVHPDYLADTVPPPPPILVDESLEYEVREILDSRVYRRQLQYLVDWKYYGPEHRTWEPLENLENCQQLIEEFHGKYPDRPRTVSIVSPRRPKKGIMSRPNDRSRRSRANQNRQ
jgi:hypothetical protein